MLEIRKVTLNDSEDILNMRNDPSIFKYFFLNPNPVDYSSHEKWLSAKLADASCYFYLGIYSGVKCGTVRYDLLQGRLNEAEVSISILPNFWGKGIAQELMKLGEERLKIDSQVQVVNATVLNENKASMALFEKAQFNPFLTKFKKNI